MTNFIFFVYFHLLARHRVVNKKTIKGHCNYFGFYNINSLNFENSSFVIDRTIEKMNKCENFTDH